MAQATLSSGKDTSRITRTALEKIKTPEAEGRWQPVAHAAIPRFIERQVEDRGWGFRYDDIRRFDIAVDKAQNRMFGVTQVTIPDVNDEEYSLAIGFRNSHDKSMSLRIAVGVNVFICDNMVMSGDIVLKRLHTLNIQPYDLVGAAFDRIPEVSAQQRGWYNQLRDIKVSYHEAISLLTDAVEYEALPIRGLMDARGLLHDAFDGQVEHINHGDTLWGVYQSITAQYKRTLLIHNPEYSGNLHRLFNQVVEAHKMDTLYSAPIN